MGWFRRTWGFAGPTGCRLQTWELLPERREMRAAARLLTPGARNDLNLRKTLAPGTWIGLLTHWRSRSWCRQRDPRPVAKVRSTPAPKRRKGINYKGAGIERVRATGAWICRVFCVWAWRVVKTRKRRKKVSSRKRIPGFLRDPLRNSYAAGSLGKPRAGEKWVGGETLAFSDPWSSRVPPPSREKPGELAGGGE